MRTIEASVVVDAPLDEVWEYAEDPVHLPEIWPSMVAVEKVEPMTDGGHRFHWQYKMAGMRFEGDSETLEYEPRRHWLQKTTGQIPSTFDWTFTPENGSTRVELRTEYEIPGTLLGRLSEPFVHRINEREAHSLLANLKDRVES